MYEPEEGRKIEQQRWLMAWIEEWNRQYREMRDRQYYDQFRWVKPDADCG